MTYNQDFQKELPDENTKLEIRSRIEELATAEGLTCSKAWEIAEEAGVKPQVVGRIADDIGIKIIRCQLGCF